MFIKENSITETPDRISSRIKPEATVSAGLLGPELGLDLKFLVGAPFIDERILG
jgi:hypothetical protein